MVVESTAVVVLDVSVAEDVLVSTAVVVDSPAVLVDEESIVVIVESIVFVLVDM